MTQITDTDLLEKVEAARGTPGYLTVLKSTGVVQERRNREREAAASKSAQLELLSPLERRRAIIREVIENDTPAPQNLQYMHTSLAICGLPYKALPPDVLSFERSQGKMSVIVQAGSLRAPDGRLVQQPIPYGPKPRLILAYLSTQAVRTQSPTVDITKSFNGFLREMGFNSTGGEKGTIKPFREQLQALAACSLHISAWDDKRSATIKTAPFSKIELWLDDTPDRSLWPGTLTFSHDFYESLRQRAMPIDSRAMRAFSNSARKLDILFWLNYRLHSINEPLVVSWKLLGAQFGDGFSRLRAFRAKFIEDMEHIQSVFPKLRYSINEDAFTLESDDPAVLAIPPALRKRLKSR